MWTKKEREINKRGERDSYEAFRKIGLQHETRLVEALIASLNVTKQPLIRRDGEKITQKKKKKIFRKQTSMSSCK